MNPTVIVMILRAILCQPDLKTWLQKQAQVSDTPIDDLALRIIYDLLSCDKEV